MSILPVSFMIIALIATLADINAARAAGSGVFQLSGIDENLPYDDFEPLAQLIAPSSVVALGESHHTSDGFYQAKFRVIKYLIEKRGFRAIAFESPWINAQKVNRYLESCLSEPEQAIKGLFGVWQAKTVANLLRWVCTYNQRHPDDKVIFFGFDIQQPWDDVLAVRARLEKIIPADQVGGYIASVAPCSGIGYGSSGDWNASEKYKSIREGTYHRLREDQADCQTALNWIEKKLDEYGGNMNARWARISTISIRAFQDQTFNLGMQAKTGMPIYNQLRYEARDRGMATVFQKIAELIVPDARVVLWAHNAHISMAGSFWDGNNFKSLGYHLNERLREKYFPIGIIGYNVEINWNATNKPRPASHKTYVDFIFHQLGMPYLFVNMLANNLIEAGKIYNWGSEYWMREIKVPGARGIPDQNFKAMIFLEHSPPMVPVP